MHVQPYLNLNGRCEEALAFYKATLGADVATCIRHEDNPGPGTGMPSGLGDKILHAVFRIGDTTLMASDGVGGGPSGFQGFSLSLTAANAAEADRLFAALAEGGKVHVPMGPSFFSPRFGIVADRFGLSWMVGAAA